VIDPNLAMAWGFSGWVRTWLADRDGAIRDLDHAMRLSPHDPQAGVTQGAIACAHFLAGRNDEAILWAESATRLRTSYQIATCVLGAALARCRRTEEARRIMSGALKANPGLRIASLLRMFPLRLAEDLAHWRAGLERAGLTD
jgi:Flp pilus assembly protein TadD